MNRLPALLALALALPACSGDDGATATDGTTTASSAGSASATTTTTAGETAAETETTGAVDPNCGSGKPTAGAGENLTATWGAPCTTSAECVALIGEGAECYSAIAGVYKAPGGYCSKPCTLPNDSTLYVPDAPDCGPGVTCLGVNGIFTACVPPCTSDAQCQRDGYTCKTLPQLGSEGDPKFCLMPDTCTVM